MFNDSREIWVAEVVGWCVDYREWGWIETQRDFLERFDYSRDKRTTHAWHWDGDLRVKRKATKRTYAKVT